LKLGFLQYCCYGTEVKEEEAKVKDTPVVYEFLDVFLEDL